MTPRAIRIVLILAAFTAALAFSFTIVLLLSDRAPKVMTQSASAIGGSFKLIDQNGNTITDQDLKGKPFLVFFGFTHCPDVCPTTLFEVSEVLRALGSDADKTGALFITVDPERDTAQKMKDYLSSFDPRLRGVTGDADSIAAVEKAYRVYARKIPTGNGEYTMDHTAAVYLMDKDGRFVTLFSVKRNPQDAAADLRRYF